MIYRLIRYDVGHVDFEDKANAEKMLEESVSSGIPRYELEIREIKYAYGSMLGMELEPPDRTSCPLCDSIMVHKEYKGTHIWSCEDCPAVLFEFYDADNLVELSRYLLNKEVIEDGQEYA